MRLVRALDAWGTPEFRDTLKQEIERLDPGALPLQEGLSRSSHATDDEIEAMIISVTEETDLIRVKAGIFYKGIIAGCSCADDPTPVEKETEYCEVRLDIDRKTGETTVFLLTTDAESAD